MYKRQGLDVTVVDCPWGEGAHEDKLADILSGLGGKDYKAVCVVHNETATGITSDIPRVREAMDASGSDALLLVDGVSSIGALPFKMDEWRVDVAVTGSQKALSLPTGLGVVCASEKALSKMASAKLKRVYFDFQCAPPHCLRVCGNSDSTSEPARPAQRVPAEEQVLVCVTAERCSVSAELGRQMTGTVGAVCLCVLAVALLRGRKLLKL